MAILHRALDEDELTQASVAELYAALGEGDTPQLFERPYKIDHDHDCPAGGGSSIDRKTKYIDRILYQEVMDGEFKVTDLSPQQIIERWLDHEHVEICIIEGDNPVDTYFPAHERALRHEHEGVLAILGRSGAEAKIKRYEETIWPGLMRCYHRSVERPPLDLWCGPLLDDPGERDEEILEQMRKAGVVDAAKRSKLDARYGMAKHRCRDCRHWAPKLLSQEHGKIAMCGVVAGAARDDRGCEYWMKGAA